MGNAAVDVLANGSRSKVKLDVFEGQLGLLLYLMKKEKANGYDIPMDGPAAPLSRRGAAWRGVGQAAVFFGAGKRRYGAPQAEGTF